LPELRAMQAIADATSDLPDDALARVAKWFSSYASRSTPRTDDSGRGISQKWKLILKAMLTGEMDIDAIQRTATEAGETITRPQARAQIHYYVKDGWVERREDGRFAITDRGRMAIAD